MRTFTLEGVEDFLTLYVTSDCLVLDGVAQTGLFETAQT